MQLPTDLLLFEILPRLPLKALLKLCQTNSQLRNLCQLEQLWENRIKYEFPIAYNTKNAYLEFSWKQFYFHLNEHQTIPIYANGDIVDSLKVYPYARERTVKEGSKWQYATLILINDRRQPILIISYPDATVQQLSKDLQSITKGVLTDEPMSKLMKPPINRGWLTKIPKIVRTIMSTLASPKSHIPIYAFTDRGRPDRIRIYDQRTVPDNQIIPTGRPCSIWEYSKLVELADFLQLPANVNGRNNLCDMIITYLKLIGHSH